ncbi:MAG: hypothetical protein ACT4PM_12045 [Gemmatimonadales bacterium]
MPIPRALVGWVMSSGMVACSSHQPEPVVEGSRRLAEQAIHASFDNGAFEAMMEQVVAASFALAKARVEAQGQHLTVAQHGELQAIIRKVLSEVYPRALWEEALLPLYLDALSREELGRMIELQRSALGSKLLAIQASVATGGGGLGERLMQSRQEQFAKRLGEELTQAFGKPKGP